MCLLCTHLVRSEPQKRYNCHNTAAIAETSQMSGKGLSGFYYYSQRLSLRGGKRLAKGHTARKFRRLDLNPWLTDSRSPISNYCAMLLLPSHHMFSRLFLCWRCSFDPRLLNLGTTDMLVNRDHWYWYLIIDNCWWLIILMTIDNSLLWGLSCSF